jgi:hypothetical protein
MANVQTPVAYAGARPDVVSVKHGDATVLLDPFSGRYYTLNNVGTFIWDRVCDAKSIAQIGAEIGNAYDVDLGQAEQDVAKFVVSLAERNLLVVTPHDGETA